MTLSEPSPVRLSSRAAKLFDLRKMHASIVSEKPVTGSLKDFCIRKVMVCRAPSEVQQYKDDPFWRTSPARRNDGRLFLCWTCRGQGTVRMPQGPYDMADERCSTCAGEGTLTEDKVSRSRMLDVERRNAQTARYEERLQVLERAVDSLGREEVAAIIKAQHFFRG